MSKPMQDGEKALVPRLRFPEFLRGDKWQQRDVGDVFTVTRGYVLSMTKVSQDETELYPYPVYSSQTKNNGLSGYYSDYLYENAITWTTDGANAGAVNYRPGKFYCTNVCGVLLNEDGYANPCVAAILNTQAKKHVSYVGNPKLMNGVMGKISLPFPGLDEQQKIADCLTAIDERISATDARIDALKAHKKGLMQQLFPCEGETTPRLRFPDFRNAGEWDECQLCELARFSSGGTPSKRNANFWNGTVPWISASSMHVTKIFRSGLNVTQLAIGNGTRIAKQGSLLILVRGSMLFKRVPIGIAMTDVAFNQDVKALDVNEELSRVFLLNQLIAISPRIPIRETGIGAGKIDTETLNELKIGVPAVNEQQKIANCLSSLDELIAATIAQRDALREHKKGMMQQLFPSPAEDMA